jgi:hypothetical protein
MPRCGNCALYRQFKAGEHIFGNKDLNAGDCLYKWMGLAYRGSNDAPVFADCFKRRVATNA